MIQAQGKHSTLKLKADFVPITVLQISHSDLDQIEIEMNRAIAKAPKYFVHMPIIIDISDLEKAQQKVDLQKLCVLLRSKKIIPVGIRGLEDKNQEEAFNHGLAILKNTKSLPSSKASTKIVSKPIRAGTRIYAKDGDLIVLTSVNSGGECIADGNIHIYGSLRGRVIAGATGNSEARIFCRSLEAELVAIAGHYLINEEFKLPPSSYSLLQIYLENNEIKIEAL